MIKRLLTGLAALTAAVGLCLGTAGAASAAVRPAAASPGVVIGGTVYTDYLAGYASTSNGDTHMDTVRSYIDLPSQATTGTPVPDDTLVVGIAQQQSEVAPSTTDGIGWVWNDSAAIGGDPVDCTNAWALAYGYGFTDLPGVPIAPGSLTLAQEFNPVTLTFGPVCMPSGESWLQLQYDHKTRRLKFYEGTAWYQNTEIADVHVGYQPMLVAGAGLDSTHGSGATADLNTGTIAAFSSARVITRGGANRSLDFYNIRKYDGTLTGGAPSVANPLTLTTSAVTGPSGSGTSAFVIAAP